MKLVVAMLFLAASSALALSGEEPTPAKRPRLTAAMMLHSTSAPAAEAEIGEGSIAAAGASAPPGVTMMAPFAVTTSALPVQVTHNRPVTAAPAEHSFDWRNGGTMLRDDGKIFSVKAGVDYDPEWNVLNFLKISW
jgi:hypothetical protein